MQPLVQLANALDQRGFYDLADRVDHLIRTANQPRDHYEYLLEQLKQLGDDYQDMVQDFHRKYSAERKAFNQWNQNQTPENQRLMEQTQLETQQAEEKHQSALKKYYQIQRQVEELNQNPPQQLQEMLELAQNNILQALQDLDPVEAESGYQDFNVRFQKGNTQLDVNIQRYYFPTGKLVGTSAFLHPEKPFEITIYCKSLDQGPLDQAVLELPDQALFNNSDRFLRIAPKQQFDPQSLHDYLENLFLALYDTPASTPEEIKQRYEAMKSKAGLEQTDVNPLQEVLQEVTRLSQQAGLLLTLNRVSPTSENPALELDWGNQVWVDLELDPQFNYDIELGYAEFYSGGKANRQDQSLNAETPPQQVALWIVEQVKNTIVEIAKQNTPAISNLISSLKDYKIINWGIEETHWYVEVEINSMPIQITVIPDEQTTDVTFSGEYPLELPTYEERYQAKKSTEQILQETGMTKLQTENNPQVLTQRVLDQLEQIQMLLPL